ncbi:MAG: DUF438 domain-containing protein [Bacteroidales bacterium]|jgi:hypothetical protein|nr:DUF438 domain-containing protein [Bacteroidales bacterium]NPV37375.1 DUF438 domain-containing protein [Bacteroidales bacterium]
MSELINNSFMRKMRLKELILKLHEGVDEDSVRAELLETLSMIPYGEVVEVEQELIEEGLPQDEVLRLCDAHSAVLEGNIDLSGMKAVPEGHPVDVFQKENDALKRVTKQAREAIEKTLNQEKVDVQIILEIRSLFNQLFDVDKHYKRKEYLLFPYLEKKGITGPPAVMWGKHDEIREQLKGSIEVLQITELPLEEWRAAAQMVLLPALNAIDDMVVKEEQILFPMSLDALSEGEWYEIDHQTPDIGFCLYDPPVQWKPNKAQANQEEMDDFSGGLVRLPSGNFNVKELMAILNTLPVDITFVDKDDKVRYFSQGPHRIFQRNRAILNRDVRYCHPPASVHIVDKILEDFRSGKASHAPFWINMRGRMIYIEYYALRDADGQYLGTLEVSQDITRYRELEGEQRILSYSK